MGWAKVSHAAAQLDQDTGFYSGSFVPVRTSETYLEITYQYQLTPAMQIQPDMQYVFNPGGGIAEPERSGDNNQKRAGAGRSHQHPVLRELST